MNSEICVLQSALTLSQFQLNKLNKEIKNSNKIISIIDIFLVSAPEVSDTNRSKLKSLLNAKEFAKRPHEIFVAPRHGTISPWSSKATDILHNCGFKDIKRIELSRCYEFEKDVTVSSIRGTHIFDRMIEEVYKDVSELTVLFEELKPRKDDEIRILNSPSKIDEINQELGLALSQSEKQYLLKSYAEIQKEPTAAELMMFAQANSEHCRHKIFNASWHIDNKKQPKSLFSMIRNTEANTPSPAVSAYKDNSAVFKGGQSVRWIKDADNKYIEETLIADILIKVETHNHPTAISPFPGAATGSGGEIRDEAATGQGSRPKAGLTGYSVSHLKIPGNIHSWEEGTIGKPERIASALDIMLEAPLGGAAFNDEFGRPNICGYFRSMEINTEDFGWRGYHKPIMLAGGLGTINHDLAIKQDTQAEDILVVLGGPAMLIGLGGGAASSMTSGSRKEDLDFASVQRGNPEMERRCQEVIDSCWAHGKDSPIRSIHDVGAGGLSNAMPELLDDAGLGGVLELRELQIDTTSMTPMEVWCNESQERYVLSIKPEKLKEFTTLCERERCPVAVLGKATKEQKLTVNDAYFNEKLVDIPMSLLFGNTPKTEKNIKRVKPKLYKFDSNSIQLDEAINKILAFPTVASKKYLITIGDRTVSGLVHRDQMVGPWQVPVADCGVTLRDFHSHAGEVMSIGEKAPLALIDGKASAQMAVCEALLNCAANAIGTLDKLKLSANWMAASGLGREDEVLFDAVKAIGEELCPQLGIGIPVGKDSLSMNSQWDEGNKKVTAPVSLLISAFANVKDVRKSLTPYFDAQKEHKFYYIDLAQGKKRLGASSLAQVYSQIGDDCPHVESIEKIKAFWQLMQILINQKLIAAYHDISDGGLFVTVLEMCMASRCGAKINIDFSKKPHIDVLLSEELGVVVAVSEEQELDFKKQIQQTNLANDIFEIGLSQTQKTLQFTDGVESIISESLIDLQEKWSLTSHQMASLRDNPKTCLQELDWIAKDDNGITPQVSFDFSDGVIAPYINLSRPKIAILREQGVNGQKEMAMAFHKAGFDAYDVHMQDLLEGRFNLNDFQGMAACGGFSYGDVLGAGKGWANSILFNEQIKAQFAEYFVDDNKFTLGVCNGCQMLSSLKEIIPGTQSWPQFLKNTSQQFEARFSSVIIEKSPSIFFEDMQGAHIPVAIAHGEGRAYFKDESCTTNRVVSYCDNNGSRTQSYPFNPNGSHNATAAVSNESGNVLIMMPHPERVFRVEQMSWYPKSWQGNSPWMRMFYNARRFVK
jgi:phosphoribosylformylglycinamidine synthase